VLLSSGLADWAELDIAVATVQNAGAKVAVFQCTTAYPCPPEKLGLNVLHTIRQRYGCPVGLSDHSGTVYAGLAAATLGADLLEVHVAFSRECFGPDVPASVTTPELADLVKGVDFIGRALSSPVDKDAMARDLSELKRIFGKSIVVARNLDAGHIITHADLRFKKPGTGISPGRLDEVVSRRLRRSVVADALLSEDDLEEYTAHSRGCAG
jgi:N-acetylneuraminate synthase